MRSFVILFLCAGCGALPVVVPPEADPDAGVELPSLRDTFTSAPLEAVVKPRVSGAGLRVHQTAAYLLTLTVTRDELGQVSKRLVATSGVTEIWAVEEGMDERFTDFTVHPSGEVTLGVERRAADQDTFDLIRLDAGGHVLHRQVLARPSTIPATDLPPAFLMKGVEDASVVRGWLPWLRLEANGEDLVVGLLSRTEGPALVSAVMSLRWDGAYSERWSRLVDGAHSEIDIVWQYDEFLWLDAATRLLVSVADDGSVVIGRTMGNGRCNSISTTFKELTMVQCRQLRSLGAAHRYQPFAYTFFSADGARLRTQVLAPEGLEEFVVFDMAVRGDQVAVAGTAVRLGADRPALYFEPPGATQNTALNPYDGYLAVVQPDGTISTQHFVDLGRGELLSALSWTDDGLVAVGGSDWNRWSGGMSLSRGAQPLLVLAPFDGPLVTRTLEVQQRDRHTHLLDVDVRGNQLVAVGPADAPMTHSGDAAIAPMAMGSIELRLR